jgi:hypothetical protein
MKPEASLSDKPGSDEDAYHRPPSIPFANILLCIAIVLLLLAAARVLLCPVPMSESSISFLKWTLGAALLFLCGGQVFRQRIKIKL